MCSCNNEGKKDGNHKVQGNNNKEDKQQVEKHEEFKENDELIDKESVKDIPEEKKEQDKRQISNKKEENETSSEIINAQQKKEDKMISIEVPVYGNPYRYYWIKNGNGDIIWSGSSYDEQQEVLDNLSNEEFAMATYGSGSKQDIIGYEIIQVPESEYENTWF